VETPRSLLCCFSVKAGIGRFRCKLNHICLTQHPSANLRAVPRKRRKPKRMVPEDRRFSVGCFRLGCDLFKGRIYKVRRKSAEAAGTSPEMRRMTSPGIRVSLRGDRERSGVHARSPSFRVSAGIIALPPRVSELEGGGERDVFQPAGGAQKTSCD
jgi:hypothetical protein